MRKYAGFAVCFLVVMIDGYDSIVLSFLAPLIGKDLGLGPADIGAIFAIGYAGAIVGALGAGSLADWAGRRPALLASLALAAVATALCAATGSAQTLAACRFVAGIGLGGAIPAVVALAAEQTDEADRRGRVTRIYIGYSVGAVIGGVTSALLGGLGWKAIFLGAGCLSLLVTLIAASMPETLAHQSARPPSATLREQFAEGRLVPALMLWLGLFCLLLLSYFLVSWTPSLLLRSGVPPARAAIGGMLLNVGGILGALVMAPIIDRFGAFRPVALLVGVGAVLVGLLGQHLGSSLFAMVMLLLVGVCIIGGQLNFPAMTAALFPVQVRATGAGWVVGVGRLGSIAGPLLGGGLISAGLGDSSLFLIAMIPALAAASAMYVASRGR